MSGDYSQGYQDALELAEEAVEKLITEVHNEIEKIRKGLVKKKNNRARNELKSVSI